MSMDNRSLPLGRFTVLDLTRVRAGPTCVREYTVHRAWIIGLAVSLGILQVHLAFAVVSEPAPEQVERGYVLLAQAHLEAESATRERLLTEAIAAFKAAYQSEPVAPAMQVQALLGAAQAASARAVPTTGVSVPVASHTAATRRKKSTAGAGAATRQCCCRLPPRPRLLASGHSGRRAAAGCPRAQQGVPHTGRSLRRPHTCLLHAGTARHASHMVQRRRYRGGVALC